jgi:hypothetical protein
MPVSMEIREKGRVLLVTYIDPVNLDDVDEMARQGLLHRDSVPHTVHVIFNFSRFTSPPLGMLRARFSPVFTHPRSGEIIFVGINLTLRSLMLLSASFTGNARRLKFFQHEAEAWTFVRQVITDAHEAEI